MNQKEMKEVVDKMSPDEKQTTIIFYLKDIKDLLESICDGAHFKKKHY